MLAFRSLIAAPCRGNVLCRERKTHSMSSWQEGSGVACALAVALQCPLHIVVQACPQMGVAGAAASPPWLLLEGELLGVCPWYLPFPGQEFFPGAEFPAEKGSMVAQLLDRQMQYRVGGNGNSVFCIFSLYLCVVSVFPVQEVLETTYPNEHKTFAVS